jgi:hypothetical protein
MSRVCRTCGRPKRSPGERYPDDHHFVIAPGLPSLCMMEFTVVEDGERREAVAEALPRGVQRTDRNQAAWVHASRL